MSKPEDERLKTLLGWLDQDKLDELSPAPQQTPAIKRGPSSRFSREGSERYNLVAELWAALNEQLQSLNNFSYLPVGMEFRRSILETILRTDDLETRENGPREFITYLRKYAHLSEKYKPPKALEFRLGNINGANPKDLIAQRLNLTTPESFTIEGLLAADEEMGMSILTLFDPEGPFRPEVAVTVYIDRANKTLHGITSVPSEIQTPHTSLAPEDFRFQHIPIPELPPVLYYTTAAGLELMIDRLTPRKPLIR